MRVTFENAGQIIDIGDVSFGSLDTTGNFGSSQSPNIVGIAIYSRALDDQKVVNYKAGIQLAPSQARAMASVLLSAATLAKT